MRFFDPANIYVEENCVANHAKDIAAFGTKALLVTGHSSAKANGSQDDVTAVLDAAGIPYEVFDEVEENPSVETVVKAAEQGKAFGADFVIGIGGGSPMDASKAIALLINNPEEDASCLYAGKDLKPTPIINIPTTCGTGSEATAISVLTRHEFKTKKSIPYKLFPDLSLVDGKYLKAASQKIIVNTTTDALAHLVESRLINGTNKFNQMFSNYGLKMYASLKPYISGEKEITDEAREQMMLVSTIAGLSIAQTGTSLPHALSYQFTYEHNIAHGRACGLLMAGYVRQYEKVQPDDVAEVLDLLEFDSVDDLAAYLRQILGSQSIPAADLERYSKEMSGRPDKMVAYPGELGYEGLMEIMKESFIAE